MSVKDAAEKCRRVAAELRERADRLDAIADKVDPPTRVETRQGDTVCECISPVMRKYNHCPECDLHIGEDEETVICPRCGALCPT